MATLAGLLRESGFTFELGTLVVHVTDDANPGWRGASDVQERRVVTKWSDPTLQAEFYTGHGGPEMPRFFARFTDENNAQKIAFPCQYDGATWIEVVNIDPHSYIIDGSMTPYPGG